MILTVADGGPECHGEPEGIYNIGTLEQFSKYKRQLKDCMKQETTYIITECIEINVIIIRVLLHSGSLITK
jgi:hypothetical protein